MLSAGCVPFPGITCKELRKTGLERAIDVLHFISPNRREEK